MSFNILSHIFIFITYFLSTEIFDAKCILNYKTGKESLKVFTNLISRKVLAKRRFQVKPTTVLPTNLKMDTVLHSRCRHLKRNLSEMTELLETSLHNLDELHRCRQHLATDAGVVQRWVAGKVLSARKKSRRSSGGQADESDVDSDVPVVTPVVRNIKLIGDLCPCYKTSFEKGLSSVLEDFRG